MKKLLPLFALLAMGAFISNSYAANPNPKPKCPKGQIAVLDGSLWQCKEPGLKASDSGKPAATTYGPVITIKPKGAQAQKDCSKEKDTAGRKVPTTPSTPQASSPASQRDKCYSNH